MKSDCLWSQGSWCGLDSYCVHPVVSIPFSRKCRDKWKFMVPHEVCDDIFYFSLSSGCRALALRKWRQLETFHQLIYLLSHIFRFSASESHSFTILYHGLTSDGCLFQCNNILTEITPLNPNLCRKKLWNKTLETSGWGTYPLLWVFCFVCL